MRQHWLRPSAAAAVETQTRSGLMDSGLAAWLVAGLATLALLFAAGSDIARRLRTHGEIDQPQLSPRMVGHKR